MKTQAIFYTLLFFPLYSQTMDSPSSSYEPRQIAMHYLRLPKYVHGPNSDLATAVCTFDSTMLLKTMENRPEMANAKIWLYDVNEADDNSDYTSAPLPVMLLLESIFAIQDAEIEPCDHSDTAKYAAMGGTLGSITGKFLFNRPISAAILGASVVGAGTYVYQGLSSKKAYYQELTNIVKTTTALFSLKQKQKQKREDYFPITDVHTAIKGEGTVMVGGRDIHLTSLHTPYNIVMSKSTLKLFGDEIVEKEEKMNAWDLIIGSVVKADAQQIVYEHTPPENWSAFVMPKNDLSNLFPEKEEEGEE